MHDLDALVARTREQLDELGVADHPVTDSYRIAAGTMLAKYFDHTVLKQETTAEMVDRLCAEARQIDAASVCVPPNRVEQAASLLAGSSVMVCTVTGFPFGYDRSEAKVAETRRAVALGALEVDMVIAVGLLLDGDLKAVYNDIRVVVEAANPVPVKLILETALLTPEQIVTAGLLGVRAGVAFLKTSTGFASAGATVENVRILRACAGHLVGVKAAGGIRSYGFAKDLIAAGADRLGASATMSILAEAGMENQA